MSRTRITPGAQTLSPTLAQTWVASAYTAQYGKVVVVSFYLSNIPALSQYTDYEILKDLPKALTMGRALAGSNATNSTHEVYQLQIDANSTTLKLRTLGKTQAAGTELRGQIVYIAA